jgi:hypothetical protein
MPTAIQSEPFRPRSGSIDNRRRQSKEKSYNQCWWNVLLEFTKTRLTFNVLTGSRLMTQVSRRNFLLSTAALSSGCVGREAMRSGPAAASIRQPVVGQSWQYAKHDRVAGTLIDTEVNRVSAVGRLIEISTQSETPGGKLRNYPSWGVRWLERYGSSDRPGGPCPSEIQGPWGMIWVDPHWSEIQAYEKPMPLWPMELRPGWSSGARYTQYQTDSEDPLPWQLTMHAHA